MSKADIVAAILLFGATLYAVFGGADFGAGAWDLLARAERDEGVRARVRERIGTSLGPVWEANHVWLIFILVVLWTGFPRAFGPIMETLYVPLALAALGIVLRGSGFAFGHAFTDRGYERARTVFALSSIVTPFFMGTVVGAIASGRVTASGGDVWSSWINPLSILIGVLFVVSGAYLAAVFLLADSRRAGDDDLVPYFTRRALAAAVVAGALALVGIFVLRSDARYVFDGLTTEGLPLLVASIAFGLAALGALARGLPRGPRPLAIAAVVAIIWGWGVGQHPYLLPETLTIQAGAGVSGALTAVIVVFCVALVTVVPAIVLLYVLAQRQALE